MTFAAHTAAIFQGPLSVSASYTATGGSPVAVRVIPSVADPVSRFNGGAFVREAGVFLLPVSVIASPAAGDTLAISGVGNFTVQGDPVRDDRRLWWRIEARPA